MTPLRIIVTGSRETTAEQDLFVVRTLTRICADARGHGRPVVIVEGRCHRGGVDRAAQHWAEQAPGVTDEGYPADWKKHGGGGGKIRNGQMVATGAELCVGFPAADSVGTWDCLKQAARAGIPGRIYPLG